RFQVPFRFKCLSYRELYDRFDSAVLFVGRRQWDITSLLVREIYGKVKDRLRPETPLFAKQIAPGLALAEDPGNGESFGTSRCRCTTRRRSRAAAPSGRDGPVPRAR